MLRLLLLTAVVLCSLAGSHVFDGEPGFQTAAATSRSALSPPSAMSSDRPARPVAPSHLPTGLALPGSVGGGSEPHTGEACALATLVARQGVLDRHPTPAGGLPDGTIGSAPSAGATMATPARCSVGLRLADLAVRQT